MWIEISLQRVSRIFIAVGKGYSRLHPGQETISKKKKKKTFQYREILHSVIPCLTYNMKVLNVDVP